MTEIFEINMMNLKKCPGYDYLPIPCFLFSKDLAINASQLRDLKVLVKLLSNGVTSITELNKF